MIKEFSIKIKQQPRLWIYRNMQKKNPPYDMTKSKFLNILLWLILLTLLLNEITYEIFSELKQSLIYIFLNAIIGYSMCFIEHLFRNKKAEAMMSENSNLNPSPGSDQDEGSKNAHNTTVNETGHIGANPNIEQAHNVRNATEGGIAGGMSTFAFTGSRDPMQLAAGVVSGGMYQMSNNKVEFKEEEKKEYKTNYDKDTHTDHFKTYSPRETNKTPQDDIFESFNNNN